MNHLSIVVLVVSLLAVSAQTGTPQDTGHGRGGTTFTDSALLCQLLSSVRNLAKLTTLKVCQVALRTQLSINALSRKKGARECWGQF